MTEGMLHVGRLMIILGLAIAALGLLITFLGKTPWLGRLPGDILIQRKNFTFYFPLATSILLSILLTFLFWMFGRK